jgi:phosphoglycerate dehydrogenase-like enzyme
MRPFHQTEALAGAAICSVPSGPWRGASFHGMLGSAQRETNEVKDMTLRVHLLRIRDETSLAHLQARLHPRIYLTLGSDPPFPTDVHVLVAGRPSRAHLTTSPDLQALVIPFAGLPEETRQLMLQFPRIAVHNLHHNAIPVAELAVALPLAAAKAVLPMDRALRGQDWRPRYEPSRSVMLHGQTALILGYGAIGQQVARLCRGLGLKVIATRRQPRHRSDIEDVEIGDGSRDTLRRLLPRADVLIITLPHTRETNGLIGEEELALLPAQAMLINVGRGHIVDESALYHALHDGRLYAAGLDVWYNRPADEAARSHTRPSSYLFHELENVVMSPHRGGQVRQTERLRMEVLAELLNAAACGELLPNRVDLQAAY